MVLPVLAVALALAPASAVAEPVCTDTWTAPSEGSWQTAANWSAGHAPTSTDVACIGSGKTAVVEAASGQAGVIQGLGTVAVRGSSLEVLNALETSVISSLELKGGTLAGAGTVAVSSSFTWNGESTMSGSGSTVVKSGATATVALNTGSFFGFDAKRKLTNEGTVTFSKGRLFFSEGAELENLGTFYANSEGGDIRFEPETAPTPTLINRGSLVRSSGTSAFSISMPLENTGTLEVHTGQLEFTGHHAGATSTAGAWSASAGASIDFAEGSYSFTGGSITGAVTDGGPGKPSVTIEGVTATGAEVTVTNGTLTFPKGSESVKGLALEEGTITGAGNIDISTSFAWTGSLGTMSGKGSTVLGPSSTSNIAIVTQWGFVSERQVINEGTMTFSRGRWFWSEGALFENRGTFYANTEGDFDEEPKTPSNQPKFINAHVMKRTSGTGKLIVYVPFEELGVLQVESGEVEIKHPILREPSTQYGGPENPSDPGQLCACVGEPVLTATGDLFEKQTDVAIGGRGVGLELTRTYNSQAAAAGNKGPFGYGWTSSFSDHLLIEKEAHEAILYQANGSTVPFSESGGAFTAPTWSQDKLSGSAEAGYTLTLPSQIQYKFSGSGGRLESVLDRYKNSTTLTYDESGRLKAIKDPTGREIALAYSAEGLVESAKDPLGNVVKYEYESGNLTKVIEPGETTPRWQFKYDGSHELTDMTNGRKGETTTEYSEGKVASQTDPAKRKLTVQYGLLETKVKNESTGSETLYTFSSGDEPTSIAHGYGTSSATTETFYYDGAGDLLSQADGNGHATSYTYDSEGNRTSMRDAAGDETKWGYDSAHDVTSTTTPNGEKTTIEREADGNAKKIERPTPGGETQVTKYEYFTTGELKSVEDPLKRVWTYGSDEHGDRSEEVDPEKDKTTWKYDADSRVESTVSPRGHVGTGKETAFTTTIKRDAQGRPVEVTAPLKHITKYEYDENGSLKALTDANGDVTKYEYDPDDHLIKTTEPTGITSETEYDGEGHVVAQIDGNKHKTSYKRNVLGEVIEVLDPKSRKTTKEYDLDGNLKKLTDAAGRSSEYEYDVANRLKKISYSDGKTHSVEYEYDKDGDRTKMVDGTGTSEYEYDQLDRLIKSIDGHKDVVSYKYDLADEQIGTVYPNGKEVTRAFDKVGRLSEITDWLKDTTKFGYDAESEQIATIFPPATGEEDTYAYDDAGGMSEVKMSKGAETLASLTYTRDKDEQVKTVAPKGLPGGEEKTTYTYDEDNRLIKAKVGTMTATSYAYDAANNPTTVGSSKYEYDEADELKKGTGVEYTYDTAGERTKTTPSSGPATTYAYDQAGNLTSVERPKEGSTSEIKDGYGYDGSGLRASQTISATTSYLTWDDAEELALLLNDGTNTYVYGPTMLPVEQIDAEGNVLYLHHDQQGSTRLLTGSAGAVQGKCSYSAYGTPTCEGIATTPLGYDGQYTNADTSLLDLRVRSYDPTTTQFLSRDPLRGATAEPYAYATDNPVNVSDPSGALCILNFIHVGPSCGEVGHALEKLNPAKYYKEEIEAYENGCGYWSSVTHGLAGALVGALDATGVGGLLEGTVGLASEEGSTAVEDVLAGLRPGRSPGAYEVDSPEELQRIYGELSRGGEPTGSSYPGHEVELRNGTRVGIREASKSGGPTVDINTGNARYKVHVAE